MIDGPTNGINIVSRPLGALHLRSAPDLFISSYATRELM